MLQLHEHSGRTVAQDGVHTHSVHNRSGNFDGDEPQTPLLILAISLLTPRPDCGTLDITDMAYVGQEKLGDGWEGGTQSITGGNAMDWGKLLDLLKSRAFISAVVGFVFLFFGERGDITLPTLIGAVVVIVSYIIGSSIEELAVSVKAYAKKM